MNRFLIAVSVLVSSLYVCEAVMRCGIAGECPGMNEIREAFPGQDNGKDYCCRTDAVTIPYCCTAVDYAEYKWDRFTQSNNADLRPPGDFGGHNRSIWLFPSEMEGPGAENTWNGTINGLHPLTKEQLLQAMEWLLRNDRDFMRKIHEAYVTSLMENLKS